MLHGHVAWFVMGHGEGGTFFGMFQVPLGGALSSQEGRTGGKKGLQAGLVGKPSRGVWSLSGPVQCVFAKATNDASLSAWHAVETASGLVTVCRSFLHRPGKVQSHTPYTEGIDVTPSTAIQ